jgi:hypothetical protein
MSPVTWEHDGRALAPAAFGPFEDAVTSKPRLKVKVLRQAEFLTEQFDCVDRLDPQLRRVHGGLGSMVLALIGLRET